MIAVVVAAVEAVVVDAVDGQHHFVNVAVVATVNQLAYRGQVSADEMWRRPAPVLSD